MRGAALLAPVVVLGLVHLLQRLEVWATDTNQRTISRLRAIGPVEAERAARSLRQTSVSQRQLEEEASHHG